MKYAALALFLALSFQATAAQAQELVPDTVTIVKAQVVEVVSDDTRPIPGIGATSIYQSIRAEILEGEDAGQVLTLDNDYLRLKAGEVFYARHTVNRIDGTNRYTVLDPYRLPVLAFFAGLFLVCLFAFGGLQGLRGLVALAASIGLIVYVLLPGILSGISPLPLSIGVAGIIIIAGSYITHGINRTTSAAVAGMLATVVVTGILAYIAVHWGRLSGFSSEEATYLNIDTRGGIDFVGLLLGGLVIGLLGILYDAAISQAIAVEELLGMNRDASRAHIFKRALRIGREHIGALVNTLAIAYVGAYLPLLLLFKLTSTQSIWITINQELFATELLRTLVGSTGLILAVPLTTALAVWMLHGRAPAAHAGHSHSHHS
ncbi:MAG: hypothetical protein JWL87_97 [Candidatus Adlerbacteria bacterium]|nr:hypothetical protein [Candidatus Adlerbacteria bacterium]